MSALIVVSGCIPRRCCPVCGAGLAYGVCLWRVGLPLFGFWTWSGPMCVRVWLRPPEGCGFSKDVLGGLVRIIW